MKVPSYPAQPEVSSEPIDQPALIEQYYQALLDKNPDYLGIFYAGVRTTSIFCLPTCRARKPKKENVAFFRTFKAALERGYRPCKICRPTENAYQPPPAVAQAMEMVRQHPKEKIRDADLRAQGISPTLLRRWFNQHYGLTFQAYQRMYRINLAYEELQHGKNATATAFDAGYESLSGFGYTYKKLMGTSPQKTGQQPPILISRLTTPIGPMFVCATETGICLLEFTNRKMLETEFQDLQKRLQAPILTGEHAHIRQVKQELAEYFAGQRTRFEVPLHPVGTAFQQSVWQALLDIPYGHTSTYLQQAQALDRPTAVRAVAAANGCNKIAILIPCHRVIGSNGHLTGYGGGLERKQWLLELEKGA